MCCSVYYAVLSLGILLAQTSTEKASEIRYSFHVCLHVHYKPTYSGILRHGSILLCEMMRL